MMHTTVSIPGIHCEGCARLIKDVSGDFTGIKNIDVDLQTKTVTLEHDDNFDMPAWKKEIESLNTAYKIQPAA